MKYVFLFFVYVNVEVYLRLLSRQSRVKLLPSSTGPATFASPYTTKGQVAISDHLRYKEESVNYLNHSKFLVNPYAACRWLIWPLQKYAKIYSARAIQ